MSDDDDWKQWRIPGVFATTVLGIAEERGHSPAALLARASIDVPAEQLFETGLSFGEHVNLMAVVGALLDDPRLGVEVGWRLPPTALGSVGYAVLSSATLGGALEVLQRYWRLVGRATTISVDTHGQIGRVEVQLRLPVDAKRRALVSEVTLVSMYRGVVALAPAAAGAVEVWFDFPEPAHAAYVRERLGQVRYGMPTSQFRFPVALLQTPLAMSNPVGLEAALKWCEREEKARGMADEGLVPRLTAALQRGADGYPTLEQMAKRMGMAPRTMRRHLRQEGTGFATLLDQARRREALRLVENPSLALSGIAEQLGYEDPANFTRAFRRWTGVTPTQHRKSVSGAGEPARSR